MKKRVKLFLKKKVWVPALIALLIPAVFFAYVYFSPGRVKNFTVGTRTAQVNITPGGINIFYPKDDTTFYYSHNFSWPPSQITGTSTKIDDVSFTKTNSSGWDFIQFPKTVATFIQSLFKQSNSPVPVPNSTSLVQKIEEELKEQLPAKEQTFTSQLIDLTLEIPPGYTLSTDKRSNHESMGVYKDSENQMSLTIFPSAKGCIDTDYSSGRWDPLRIKIGGKYPVTFTHNSISHGESGHSYGAQALANNDYCISATMNINLLNQKEFTDILEGK